MFDHNRLRRTWKQRRKERRRASFPERKGLNVVHAHVTPGSNAFGTKRPWVQVPQPGPRRRSLRTAQKRQALDASAFSSAVLRVSSSPHRSALRRGPHVRASSVWLRKSSRFWRLLFLRLYSAAPPFPHTTRCAGLARGPVLKNAVRKLAPSSEIPPHGSETANA